MTSGPGPWASTARRAGPTTTCSSATASAAGGTSRPILRRKSEHVLEAGIVLAPEPHVNFWHVQDMILVTDGAPVLLSPKFNTDRAFVAAA